MECYDLVILGGGLAGLCAAVEAGERNAKVLLLEKEEEVGGSSLLSGRYMAFAGTDMQHAANINDSSALLIEDMMEVGGDVNDPQLVNAYGRHQLETYNWLVRHGIEFRSLQAVSGHSVPRGHTIIPHQAIHSLLERIRLLPSVTVRRNARAKRLLKNEVGRIDRVIYETGEKEQTIHATKGIIITSGGFSRSEALLSHFAPQLKGALRIGGKGNHGDGLKMAWEQGAWVRDMAYLKGTYGFHPTADGPVKSQGLAFYKGAIIVNKFGKRFINESLSYKLLGTAALEQPEGITYQIWDQTVMNQSVAGDALYDLEQLQRRGLIHKADTLEELMNDIHVPIEELKKTINKYNKDIQNGGDLDFGRKTLTHTFGNPTPVEKAPFYAFRTTVAMLATYGGLSVNELAQVVNPFGEPIEGLFAAGEVTGGFHGAGYMTGSSLGKAAIFGRLSSINALAIGTEIKQVNG